MSDYFDPFDADRPLRLGCSCGRHGSEAEHAAATLRARAHSAGVSCEVLTPSDEGTDWCDVWVQRGTVTIEGAMT